MNARNKTSKIKASREWLDLWINRLFGECVGWDREAKSVGSENQFDLEFFCITFQLDIYSRCLAHRKKKKSK